MAKKALIHKTDKRGQDLRGYRITDVVNIGDEFEVHSDFEWVDCSDTVEIDKYWYDPITSSIRISPRYINPQDTLEALATDSEGNPTEDYEWDWDNEVWKKVQVL